ncbi:hypothetical protein M9H77_22860 [Catharanthus roseus]|uniref:Uncharacterized protein n=1 Tax=Catharanthus roseus TaxID=4058 RepID=A0ACC0ARB2_CATRO|nr:hypothetical protein M9H77_22860 [Catharanthus roseus]
MDRVERERRARHFRELRKYIIKQRRNKRRLRITQVNFPMNETYDCLNGRRVNDEPMENSHPRTRKNKKRTALKNRVTIDNRWVVPNNIDLVVKYQVHINVEWCSQGRAIKYLFEYIIKGQDRTCFVIEENISSNPVDRSQSIREVDEIKSRECDAPYLSARSPAAE